jgi:hypothetical protein
MATVTVHGSWYDQRRRPHLQCARAIVADEVNCDVLRQTVVLAQRYNNAIEALLHHEAGTIGTHDLHTTGVQGTRQWGGGTCAGADAV